MNAKKVFIVYDGRARGGDTSEAQVLSSAHSLREAREDAKDSGFSDACIYSYDLINGKAVNERRENGD